MAYNPSTPTDVLLAVYKELIIKYPLSSNLIVKMLNNGLQLYQSELEALVASHDQAVAQAVAEHVLVPKNSVLALQLQSFGLEYQVDELVVETKVTLAEL